MFRSHLVCNQVKLATFIILSNALITIWLTYAIGQRISIVTVFKIATRHPYKQIQRHCFVMHSLNRVSTLPLRDDRLYSRRKVSA
jgi:hypothetical protein